MSLLFLSFFDGAAKFEPLRWVPRASAPIRCARSSPMHVVITFGLALQPLGPSQSAVRPRAVVSSKAKAIRILRNKDATRSKCLTSSNKDATRGSWPRY